MEQLNSTPEPTLTVDDDDISDFSDSDDSDFVYYLPHCLPLYY